jgi:hypothetical protein
MKVWASVDPKNINEEANFVVLYDDGCRDWYGLVVWDCSILFLDGLPF